MELVLISEPFTEERGGYTFQGEEPMILTKTQFMSLEVDINNVRLVGSYAQCLQKAMEINVERGRFRVLCDQLSLMN